MQRKIPLKRYTPLKRTPLVRKASKPLKRTAKIKPKSDKRIKEEVLYDQERKAYLVNHPLCEASLQGYCKKKSTEIHHKKGRIGKLLYDATFFLAVCRPCHNWIENNVAASKQLGFSISRLNGNLL